MSIIKVQLDHISGKKEVKEVEYEPEAPCPFCIDGNLGEGFPGDQCFACGATVIGIYGTKEKKHEN
jgi:uncharacterized protein (DUF983 family)